MIVMVDARMLRISGIGVVTRAVLSSDWLPDHCRAVLLVKRADFDFAVAEFGERYRLQICEAPVYSLREHFERVYWALAYGADAFWVPHYNTNVLSALMTFTTIHDCAHLALPEIFSSLPMRIYSRAMLSLALLSSRQLLFVSNFTANEVRRLCPYASGKGVVSSPGVAEVWRSAPPIQKDGMGKYVLFVGNVKPHKNLRRCIDAFGLVAERIPHSLRIVGVAEGFITGDENLAGHSASLEGRVEIMGPQKFDDLRALVAGAEFLIFPSLYEGFGLPVLEAMAAGCPVLSADIPSVREMAGDAVHYVDPRSTESIAWGIELMAGCASLRAELRAKGLVRSRAFSWQAMTSASRRCVAAMQVSLETVV